MSLKYVFLFVGFPVFLSAQDYNFINSVPQNAEVYYNDSLLGSTPLHIISPQGYPSRIKLKLDRYIDFVYDVQPNDTLLNKTFYLIPLKYISSTEKIVIENKNYLFKKNRKILPITLLGTLTAGSAIISYHFKTLANETYSDYLRTAEQEKLDKTKRYDLISGVSLAAFQVGLLGVIYFLFIE